MTRKLTRRFFVTGTGTDVGKTAVTRALVRALVLQGFSVGVAKPVESGVPRINGVLRPSDALALLRAARCDQPWQQACCYAFEAPVSPHLAAAMEGETIDAAHLHAFVQNAVDDAAIYFAEGAGGLLVPLSDALLYGDFIAQTGFELLIVAPNRLGVINDTLLTIAAARQRGIPIAGGVLNGTSDIPLGNADAISRWGDVPVLGVFPTVDISDVADADALFAAAAKQHLSLTRLLPTSP